ncbi:c-type cytochrome [Flavihumibacter profundi]|uniref:c-type cytochrome n=1 Tax=Flavihumibacter profundi TaxID=2716883 RepID=UPI001CC5B861|nr:c-type cytochrome [Flavihumibacter profundi]MBZ5856096.1 c-type cytochrome [Flavihumibacter profundi]
MQRYPLIKFLPVIAAFLLVFSCKTEKKQQEPQVAADPKVAKLKLPEGFNADHLFGPSENGEGSWVAMTFDNKGRIIASDQYGSLYRMVIPAIGDTSTKIKVEQLTIPTAKGEKPDTSGKKIAMGYAHGLLYAFNSLYVMINHESDSEFNKGSGLYRMQDTDGDDQYDKITLLKALDGEGEHGPHSIVLSPDKQSLYVIAGNFTKIPKMNAYRNFPESKLDNIMPLIKDPNGHDNTVNWHGGWIANVDSTGSNWELYASGFRNPFDLAFNEEGDMFTYDSDMEWDIGTPWYRPTRICHVTSGSEFGWRPGTDKWSPVWPDNSPAILNIGQGSPTNVVYGANAHFPEKYRRSVFAFDWSFGIIYAMHLEQQGSSYKATGEEFVSGSPLPLTDGVIGPDGALYFLTGGRRLESDLYRVYYGDSKQNTEPLAPQALNEDHKIRRKLEEYHGAPKAGAVDFVWPYLKHEDRFIRYAARVALEHQPVKEWQDRVVAEKDPVILTQGAIALARKGNASIKDKLLEAMAAVNYTALSEPQQVDLVRSIELVISRMGIPGTKAKSGITSYLEAQYPSKSGNELNRELSKVLVYLGDPQATQKTVALLATAKDDNSAGQETFTSSSDLIMRNPQYGMDIASMLSKMPPLQQTFYATVLSQAKTGWTPELQDAYFKWYYNAFSFRGGHSFTGFINGARKLALANVPKDKFAYFNTISGDSIAELSGAALAKGAIRPKGPGRDWTIEEATKIADSGISHRDFERGKGLFTASLCSSCHNMRGEGGIAGPDLTQLGTRFSYKDMLEAIIDPSKTISDQYGATVFSLKKGGSVVGRLISQDDDKYVISQNPFAPQVTRELKKSDVSGTRVSEISPMLPGMINQLNPEELKDLLAFLKSGGNSQDTIFAAKQGTK